jgi:hypothetical protein
MPRRRDALRPIIEVATVATYVAACVAVILLVRMLTKGSWQFMLEGAVVFLAAGFSKGAGKVGSRLAKNILDRESSNSPAR